MGTEEHFEEVPSTKVVKGKVRFGIDQIGIPAPDRWLRISKGLKYFFTGLVAIVSGTPFLTSKASNIINFCIALSILTLGAVDMMLGVSPSSND